MLHIKHSKEQSLIQLPFTFEYSQDIYIFRKFSQLRGVVEK